MRTAETHELRKTDGKHGELSQCGQARNDGQPREIKMDQGQCQIKGKAVRSRLARTSLDFGRARWVRSKAEPMNGQRKCLSDRNTFFIYDTDERGSGIGGKYSRMFAYVRVMGEKMLRGRP